MSKISLKTASNNSGKRASVDLTTGSILKRIITFTIPIILTGVLQLLFNAADIIVVGNFASSDSLAAVGSTSAFINLIINLMLGLSVGAGVCSATCFGSRDDKGLHEVLHTSIMVALIGGIFFGLLGFFVAKPMLSLMQTPENVIDKSTLYVKIYFVGVPFSVIYNFGAAVLRSVGNTKQPLIFLTLAGVINVIFNLIFVIVFNMDVAGVAWATVISQVISCVLVIGCLLRVDGAHRLFFGKLKIYKRRLIDILVIGVPAGIQGSMFSISNIIIQSSINGFGSIAMAGNGAAESIGGFIYTCMNAFHHTMLTFTGQHMGANKIKRIKSILLKCLGCVCVVGILLGAIGLLFGDELLSIYASDQQEVIEYGKIKLSIICATYFTCGIMDVLSGALRGMGKSFSSMLMALSCICGLRIVWIYTVFQMKKTLFILYLSYPISWIACIIGEVILYVFTYKKLMEKQKNDNVTVKK